MKKNLKSVLVLTAICTVVGLLMAVTNQFTAPIIEKNQAAAANESLIVVMPEGKSFEKLDISSYSLPSTVTEAYKEESGGFVVKLVTSGYSDGLIIMCGIDNAGNVTGAVCLGSSETLGYEKEYGNQVVGATLDSIDSVDTISGATMTTTGYKNAVKDALKAFVVFSGGSVETRTEEEILADSLAAALPSGNGEFEEVFIVEKLEGIDNIYSAKNNTGFVYVVGDKFVGIDANGNIVGQIDDETKALALDAFAIMSASNMVEIDISKLDLPQNIIKVSKTDSGNYVFELRASGFGIYGDEWYSPSGEYIYISLCATKDKEIISIKTTAQSESDGIGSVCADEEFYGQFVGKNDTNYKEIDAISGATLTTDGYKTAVGRALESISILKGAN